MSILEKLKAGKRNVRSIKWPGTNVEIGITILSEAELKEAAFETQRHFDKEGIEVKLLEMAVVYDKEKTTQILFRALVDPARPKQDGSFERAFPRVDDLRALFTSDAVKDKLVSEYNELKAEANPDIEEMTEAALAAIADTVKKTPDAMNDFSSNTLRQLLRFMVSRPGTLLPDSGSISS